MGPIDKLISIVRPVGLLVICFSGKCTGIKEHVSGDANPRSWCPKACYRLPGVSILGLSPLIRWNPYILGGCTLCPSRPAYLGIPPLRGVALVLDEDPVRPKTQTWGQVGKSCPRYRSMMVYVPGYTLGMRQDRCIRVLLSDLFGHWHFGSRCGCRPG